MQETKTYLNENDILAGIKADDNRALLHIYRQYQVMVVDYILKNSGSQEEAKDCFQDAVVIFYQKIRHGSLELTAGIGTYLFAVSRNLWLKKLRDKKNNNITDAIDTVDIAEENNDAEMLKTERIEKLMESLEKISEHCQNLLKAYYFDKLKMKDICTRFNYNNEDTAKNQKYKCVQSLKKKALENSK